MENVKHIIPMHFNYYNYKILYGIIIDHVYFYLNQNEYNYEY